METLSEIPHSVLAAGWVPFTVMLLVAVVFSFVYVMWYRSVHSGERSFSATFISIISMTATLLTSILVPVDVFLVSFMKEANGTYKPWAENAELRASVEDSVLYAYYTCYGIILAFAFVILPITYFYHMDADLEDDDSDLPTAPPLEGEASAATDVEYRSRSSKLCRALKYELACLIVFAGLILVGIFVPMGDSPSPPHNLTTWQKIEFIIEHEFGEAEKGQNLMVFILNVLNVVGMFFLILYTGFGLSTLPIGMIRGHRGSVHYRRRRIDAELRAIESEIAEIQERWARGPIGGVQHFEQVQVERLEQQSRLLRRTQRDLDQTGKSCVNRIIAFLRPFQVIFGILFAVFGFLIFVSLLLTSVDKAMHSLGPLNGYVLLNGTLPNPADIALVYAQDIYPLDYLLYLGFVVFLLFCSVSGLKNLGIRFCWIRVYEIKASATKPQALSLMCLFLILVNLALNVVMFSVAPDYTTFGSQHYLANVTVGNTTEYVTKLCKDVPMTKIDPLPEDCNMSRIAYLSLAFHSTAWIFGAAYFWLIWLFLVVILVGSLITIFRKKTYNSNGEHDLDDEDELLNPSNPFSTDD